MKYTKSELRKLKKAQLQDMYREEFPFSSKFCFNCYTKEDLIRKLLEASE